MSDPNEGEETLIKNPIEPDAVGEATIPVEREAANEEDKKDKNESDARSSLNRSRSDDSLKNDVNLADSIIGDAELNKEEKPVKQEIPENYYYS